MVLDSAHPVLAAVAHVRADLTAAHGAVDAGSDPSWLPAAEQARLLEDLGRARAQLDHLLMRALTATSGPDGVTSSDGSRSAADWLAHRLHVHPSRLAGEAKLGAAVEPRRLLAAALTTGEDATEHARAVTDVLDDLPVADLTPEVVAEAEQVLVGHCASFTPPEVRRLGRHLLDTLDPDTAEAAEAARLAALEREAQRRTKLRLVRTTDGTRRLTGEIPELTASLLEAALRALAHPRRDHLHSDSDGSTETPPADDGQMLTDPQRLGQAFCTLVEHLPTDALPTHGGTPVTVVVTVDHARLAHDLDEAGFSGVATLDTGATLSPGALRRLACSHGVLAAILDGDSQVLDLGREQRFFQKAQRIVMRVAHPECQAAGCTIPAAWCEAHHRQPWSRGGTTDLHDGALLCAHHHRRAHDPHYDTTWHPDHSVTFHRRT